MGSNELLWLHLVFTYLYTGFVYVQLGRFAYEILGLRWNYWLKIRRTLPARSVMVTGISWNTNSNLELARYFRKHIGDVESVEILPQVGSLGDMIYKRAKLLEQLESRITWLIGNPCPAPRYDPVELKANILSTIDSDVMLHHFLAPYERAKAFWCKSHASHWYGQTEKLWKEFLHVDQELKEKRQHTSINHSPTQVGFVTFENTTSAQLAAQLVTSAAPFQMQTTLAPEPCNVYWANTIYPAGYRFIRSFAALCIVAILYVAWLPLLFYIAQKLQSGNLSENFPKLVELLNRNPLIAGALFYTAPLLILSGFNFAVPYFLTWVNTYSGLLTNSNIQINTLKRYHFFLLMSVILVFSLRDGMPDLRDFMEDPGKVAQKLAQLLPRAAPFFMNFVSFYGIGFTPLRLLRPDYYIFRMFSRTPRRLAELRRPVQLNWSFLYPHPLLVFAIGMTYSTLAPLISVLAFVYFALNYIANKYLIMFIYTRPYETAGSLCLHILQQLPIGMLIYHLLIFGLLATNGKNWCLPFMLPLLAFNIWLIGQWVYSYESHIDFVPLELLHEADAHEEVPPSPFTTTTTNTFHAASSQINMATIRRQDIGGSDSPFDYRPQSDQQGTASGSSTPTAPRLSIQVNADDRFWNTNNFLCQPIYLPGKRLGLGIAEPLISPESYLSAHGTELSAIYGVLFTSIPRPHQ